MSRKRPADNVFFKRKLIATAVRRVAPPEPVIDKISTEFHCPRTMADIFGNSPMKQKIKTWMRAGGPTLCCISGPVGCGKTSLARVVMTDAGREIVHLRDSPDMFTILTDMLDSTHRKRMGVIIDEIENLIPTGRTKLLKILTRKNPGLPVICICTDATERAMKTFVKACSTHIQMVKPSTIVAAEVARKVGPRLDAEACNTIARGVNGDLRQATILAHQARVEQKHRAVILERRAYDAGRQRPKATTDRPARAPDRRIGNIFEAAAMAFAARSVELVVDTMQYDALVPMMAQDAIPGRMYTVATGLAQHAQLEDLSARLDSMCDADLLDSHRAHQTHQYAHQRYAHGVFGLKPRAAAPKPSFPKTLGLGARRRGNAEVITEIMDSRFRSSRTDPLAVQLVREGVVKGEKADVKKFKLIKF